MPLSSLVIMSHEGNDDVPEGRVFKLAPDADVILTLKEGGEEELLTFTPGNGQLRMQSAKIFMRESGTHRLVQANNGRLRVVRVQGKTRGGGSIDEPLDRGPKKVFIVITPLPE